MESAYIDYEKKYVQEGSVEEDTISIGAAEQSLELPPGRHSIPKDDGIPPEYQEDVAMLKAFLVLLQNAIWSLPQGLQAWWQRFDADRSN